MEAHATMILGVTYWPRRVGYRFWSALDRGELREEMQQLATLGVSDVRVCLTWEAVQPAPRKISGDVLRTFERVLDEAEGNRLRVIAGLFPAAIGGALFVPRWVANPDPLNDLLRTGAVNPDLIDAPDLPEVVYEGSYRANTARELFRDSMLIEAQRYQINEVIGYFGSHPALRCWQLGEGLERVRPPAADDVVDEWYTTMVETARSAYPGAQLLGVTTTYGLLNRAGPRPEQLAETCDMVGLAFDAPLPLPEFRPDSMDALEFAYTLAARLAGRPVAALGIGLPTAPGGRSVVAGDTLYGQHVTTMFASSQQQGEFVGRAIERLRNLGAPLVVLADYADYPADLLREAPLDRSVRSRSLGLVDAAGREKPSFESVQSFKGARVQPNLNLSFEVDPERYWHDPAGECLRLWREYMRER